MAGPRSCICQVTCKETSCRSIGLEYSSRQNRALQGEKPFWGVLPARRAHTSAYRSCASPPLVWYFHLTPFYFQTHMEIIALPLLPRRVPRLGVFHGADVKKREKEGGQVRPHGSCGMCVPAAGGAARSQQHAMEGARPCRGSLWFPISPGMRFSGL